MPRKRGVADEFKVEVPWALGLRFRQVLLIEGLKVRPVLEDCIRRWVEQQERRKAKQEAKQRAAFEQAHQVSPTDPP